jgi:chromosomal replication initiator protein
VLAYAKLLRVNATVETALKALENVGARESAPGDITPSVIIRAVSESFQIAGEELAGKKRDKDTALARRLAMYLIRQETNSSLAQIGQALGHRDAASVTAACKLIAGNIEKSPYLKRKVRDIQQSLRR